MTTPEPAERKENALDRALRGLADNDHFTVLLNELKSRREDVHMRAEMDSVMRDHPTLIGCVQYSRCLGELIHLFEKYR